MSEYAQVENNIVVNVVEAEADWIALQPGTWILYDNANPCAIGWAVENGACVIPPVPPTPID
jgi:hypothetical protein